MVAMPAAAAVARLRSWRGPGPLSESVAPGPDLSDTKALSAKTLRHGAELRRIEKRALELAARKDIDLAGLGQVLPEEVPRAILVGRRTDVIVRPDRPGPGRGCRGRLRAAAATTPPVVGLTDARRVEWRIASLHGRPAPTRRARIPHQGCGLVASG